MFGNCTFSSIFFISLLRLVISALTFSRLFFSGWISLTSVRTLNSRSLTWASVLPSASMFSFIRSRISLFCSRSWASTAVWVLASERILFRKISTGFEKAMAHVIPHRMSVVMVVDQK